MTREELSQLRYLSKEIKLLEEQIKNVSYEMTSDSVKGSDVNYPYTYRSIPISGIDVDSYNHEVSKLKGKLMKRKSEIINLACKINDYIQDIEHSEIRQIIILKYINGLTWTQIAIHLHYADESVPRKKLDRYFKMTD